MKKIKLLLIILFAIIGALIIYNHFEKIKPKEEEINKFSTEYTLVDSENIFEYNSIDEVIDILSNQTGIVFMCTPESNWCQHYAYHLNNICKKNNIQKIHYINITEYRELNTTKYQKLVDLLENYIYVNDIGIKKIYMPDLTFVKNGEIIAHDNETSLVNSELVIENYWTNNKITEFNSKISKYIELLNKEEEEIKGDD